jgi:S1-C subfamily serine protease
MSDHLRRFFFAFAVFLVAGAIFGWTRSRLSGYGLLDAMNGKVPPAEAFTEATGPKLSLTDVEGLARLDDEYAKLAAAVLPSVVSVSTRSVVMQRRTVPFGLFSFQDYAPGETKGIGSGAIISKEGHVVTNHHVIEGAQEVTVTTNENETFSAKVIGSSPERDIALLKIVTAKAKEFPALTFADSDKTRVGQLVFAVGNPFGLSGTVTQGIISARDRHLSDSQSRDYLQTDTVINPGNSGGPLVNIRGEILGVNVAIYRGDEKVHSWQGVGLAVPANQAKQVVESIRELASGKRPEAKRIGYLGIEVTRNPVRILNEAGDVELGVPISYVWPDSPAAEAGLLPSDVVIAFDDIPSTSGEELLALIRKTPPGTSVKLKVLRQGLTYLVDATVGLAKR